MVLQVNISLQFIQIIHCKSFLNYSRKLFLRQKSKFFGKKCKLISKSESQVILVMLASWQQVKLMKSVENSSFSWVSLIPVMACKLLTTLSFLLFLNERH